MTVPITVNAAPVPDERPTIAHVADKIATCVLVRDIVPAAGNAECFVPLVEKWFLDGSGDIFRANPA
jgi:hypothetical protein